MYAVIDQNGHQYKVTVGQEIDIDNLNYESGKVFYNNKVLLLVESGHVQIGKPYLEKVKVGMRVIKKYKGGKIRVLRFKAKSRYTKTHGFRPLLTRVKVESIKE